MDGGSGEADGATGITDAGDGTADSGSGQEGGSSTTDGGAPPTLNENGLAALNGEAGIVGTVDGTVYAYTKLPNPGGGPQGMTIKSDGQGGLVANFSATAEGGSKSGSWEVTVPAAVGVWTCEDDDKPHPFLKVDFNLSTPKGTPRGTTGACEIRIASLVGEVRASFTTSFATDGFISMPGLPDCAQVTEPELPDGSLGATLLIDEPITTWPAKLYCSGSKLLFAEARLRDSDTGSGRYIRFTGKVAGLANEPLTIKELAFNGGAGTGTGTFPCDFYSEKDGTCTVTVTTWTDELIEGSFTGTTQEQPSTGSTSHTFSGHFRGKAYQ